jgi:hypothetical protein
MPVIKVRPMTSFHRFCDPRLFGIPLPLLTCVITIWAPAATVLPEHVQGAFLIQTRKRHHLLAVSRPILYMTSSPEPLLPEIRRVFVQTPLPFRSMTAVRCGRGCTFVAPFIQYTLVSKRPGNVRCQLVRSDLGLHHCVLTNLGKPLSFGI